MVRPYTRDKPEPAPRPGPSVEPKPTAICVKCAHVCKGFDGSTHARDLRCSAVGELVIPGRTCYVTGEVRPDVYRPARCVETNARGLCEKFEPSEAEHVQDPPNRVEHPSGDPYRDVPFAPSARRHVAETPDDEFPTAAVCIAAIAACIVLAAVLLQ